MASGTHPSINRPGARGRTTSSSRISRTTSMPIQNPTRRHSLGRAMPLLHSSGMYWRYFQVALCQISHEASSTAKPVRRGRCTRGLCLRTARTRTQTHSPAGLSIATCGLSQMQPPPAGARARCLRCFRRAATARSAAIRTITAARGVTAALRRGRRPATTRRASLRTQRSPPISPCSQGRKR